MYKKFLKPWILCCLFVFVCFGFTGCGNQSEEYNADETTNSRNENTTENMTSDDNSAHTGTDSGMEQSPGQDLENAVDDIGDGIENAGEGIMNGAEDLLDGESSQNSTIQDNTKDNREQDHQKNSTVEQKN